MQGLLAILSLLAILALPFSAGAAAAAGEGRAEMNAWADRLRLAGEIGPTNYRYEEHFGATSSHLESEGISWTLLADLDLFPRVRIGAAWEAARIGRDMEAWSNLPAGTVMGTQVNQTNDTRVDIDMMDVYVSLGAVRTSLVEIEFLAGWHVLRHHFERSNFAFQVAGFTINSVLGPVSEDVSANGPAIGARLTTRFDGFILAGGLQWVLFPDVEADNSLLGTINSEGNSLRWRLAIGYRATDWMEFGLSYRGTYLEVDEGRSAHAVLPNNRTYINSIFLQGVIRF